LDNHLGPNLSEETITNPHLSNLASLRTNEEASVKMNTEMFDNEDVSWERLGEFPYFRNIFLW